ncbi:MAG: GGDEF domain-containing protein [Magnetococcales bacterium]|nr:GGDEF domain-containing protein [Magnetococcales bacterium]
MSTITLIETLYDLLKEKKPDLPRALSLIEQARSTGICAEERHHGKAMIEGLFSTLEQWYVDHESFRSALGECRRLLEETRDPTLFARTCTPLLSRTLPERPLRENHDPRKELPGKIIEALKILAEEAPPIRIRLQSLSPEPPSMAQVFKILESKVPVETESPGKRDDERLWDNAWRRLETGLEEMFAHPATNDQTSALFQRKMEPPETKDRSARMARVIEHTEDWMREAGRIGQLLDGCREKGITLKKRIDELELAITASQTASFIDPRTGLSDHSSFSARLNRLLDRASHLGEIFSLGVVRVKTHPSRLSREARESLDDLMQNTATCIRHHLSQSDFIARIAPDRLGLLLPKTGAKRCRELMDTLHHSLAAEIEMIDPAANLHPKIICSGFPFQQGMTIKEIMVQVTRITDDLGPVEPTLTSPSITTSEVTTASEEIILD